MVGKKKADAFYICCESEQTPEGFTQLRLLSALLSFWPMHSTHTQQHQHEALSTQECETSISLHHNYGL